MQSLSALDIVIKKCIFILANRHRKRAKEEHRNLFDRRKIGFKSRLKREVTEFGVLVAGNSVQVGSWIVKERERLFNQKY